jgi:hypothetical protein
MFRRANEPYAIAAKGSRENRGHFVGQFIRYLLAGAPRRIRDRAALLDRVSASGPCRCLRRSCHPLQCPMDQRGEDAACRRVFAGCRMERSDDCGPRLHPSAGMCIQPVSELRGVWMRDVVISRCGTLFHEPEGVEHLHQANPDLRFFFVEEVNVLLSF